ncbi:MAG: sigma-70 family RNA polymerase sigma factor [Chitinophagaceae bacterium]|nr:sigma-70 family RNA polymerase sigma factor [Chitinophagaceae bacterium]
MSFISFREKKENIFGFTIQNNTTKQRKEDGYDSPLPAFIPMKNFKMSVSNYSEETIIRGCQQGKQTFQTLLYERYSAVLLGLCRRYIKKSADAEDIMIHSFVKIFENIKKYTFTGSFEGWIKRITINECLQFLRKNKLIFVDMDTLHKNEVIEAEYDNTELDEMYLLEMVNSLSTGYKTVFNLYVIEGYTHKEIADILGITENTSKSNLSRARDILRGRILAQKKNNLIV